MNTYPLENKQQSYKEWGLSLNNEKKLIEILLQFLTCIIHAKLLKTKQQEKKINPWCKLKSSNAQI